MTEQRAAMVAEARARYGAIKPCAGKRRLRDCFTDEGKYGVLFWFNSADGSTRVLIEKDKSGETEQGTIRCGIAGQDKTRRDVARLGSTEPGKTERD